MMAGNVSIEQRKWVLKQYWETKCQYQRRTINTILYTIYYILYSIPTFGPPCIF